MCLYVGMRCTSCYPLLPIFNSQICLIFYFSRKILLFLPQTAAEGKVLPLKVPSFPLVFASVSSHRYNTECLSQWGFCLKVRGARSQNHFKLLNDTLTVMTIYHDMSIIGCQLVIIFGVQQICTEYYNMTIWQYRIMRIGQIVETTRFHI